MTDLAVTPGRAWRVARLAAWLALLLAVAALVVLALVPLGWRAGLWHFRVSLLTLMPWAAYLGIAGAVLGLVTLFAWSRLSGAARVGAALALIVGAAVAYVPWSYQQLRTTMPPIHDITTDAADPPRFAAVLPAREAAKANALAYDAATAQQQIKAFPDLQPVITKLPPAQAFARAEAAARAMPGWQLIAADPQAMRIEASHASRWMGFVDDVVIRVRPEEGGSRIDVRSVSRVGRSDFGANAGRVRAYLAALKSKLA